MELEAAKLATVIQKTYTTYWRKYQLRARYLSWPILIGLIVSGISLLFLPFVERTWRATGDEPHYLLATHSLVTDFDFDLTNNYDQLDYLAFYFSKDIARQVRTNVAGQQILSHHLGLPVLIAPAYALGGRFGVLVFQAILGGLLALLTFKLAAFISQDEKAAFLAALFVALSPPLFLYQYLVYPELMGALFTMLVLYYSISRSKIRGVRHASRQMPNGAASEDAGSSKLDLLSVTQSKPGWGPGMLVIFSLMALPWLNRRFIPLAILLALLIGWAWRRRGASSLWHAISGSFPALIAVLISIALLLGFNTQLSEPARVEFTAPAGTLLLERLARGVGWLVDQQRGLFIFAPIYLLTLWGLLFLIDRSPVGAFAPGLSKQLTLNGRYPGHRTWWVILPFLLSWGITAAAGSFWVAWELGPRFLVVALPALAPLLALAWRSYGRSKIWQGLAIFLFGLSLSNSLVIIRYPELPYKSSLPLFYAEIFHLPLTEFLPDLAGYARISASPGETGPDLAQVTTDQGELIWFAEAKNSVRIVNSGPLEALPFGHYRLTWPVRLEENLPPTTEVMRISIKLLGGGQVFNKIITAADLPRDGSYGMIELSLLNPNVDRWRTPLIFQAVSSGHSNIWAKDVLFAPDPFYGWFMPYGGLALIVMGAFLTWHRFGRSEALLASSAQQRRLLTMPANLGGVALALFLAAVGYSFFQYNQAGRTYEAAELKHFVGRAIADAQTEDGQAWLVDPGVDPPQKAIYGPFDIYDPGQYQVAFRLKLPEAVDTGQELARLQVSATANFEALRTQSLRPEHFSEPGLYHDFVLTIDNPRRQALSFEVEYLGIAALVIDHVTIRKIKD